MTYSRFLLISAAIALFIAALFAFLLGHVSKVAGVDVDGAAVAGCALLGFGLWALSVAVSGRND